MGGGDLYYSFAEFRVLMNNKMSSADHLAIGEPQSGSVSNRGRSVYAIVDCDCFYCSCERLFDPSVTGKPVVVLSNNDGCIISRSDEAKSLGVRMGVPYFEAKSVIEKNGVKASSSNYHLYGDISMRVMDTLRALVGRERVEVYSVDEAFLRLDHIDPERLESFAVEIRDTVQCWTGIPVSVGIAATKTLAKIASRLAKKEKARTGCTLLLLDEEVQRKALMETRVSGIWGIGRSYASKLIGLGITSGWELRNMPESWAHTHLGGVVGRRLIRELRGEPALTMREELDGKKMIATTRMFGRPVTALNELKEAVATYTSRAAEKLRRQQCAATEISVFIVPREENYSLDFRNAPQFTARATLSQATSLTNELIKSAMRLVEEIFSPGATYKKAGVMLGKIRPDVSIQGNFFRTDSGRSNRYLMSAVDNVNFSMRDDVVKFVGTGLDKSWKMRQELRSKRCSTRWDELKEIT